jgi:hypothetical protein
MATDYDAPRKTDEELNEDSIEELKTRRNDKNSGKVDEDEAEAAEAFELPGADLSHEELPTATPTASTARADRHGRTRRASSRSAPSPDHRVHMSM